MKKILLIIFAFSGYISQAQTTKYQLPGIGFITVSNTMEVQGGVYKDKINNYLQANGNSTSNRYVFQQKGINSGTSSSYNTYARIIIKKDSNAPSSYFNKLKSNIMYTKAELETLNTLLKKEIQGAIPQNANAKITYWGGVSQNKINGQNTLECNYTRSANSSPSSTNIKRLFFIKTNKLYMVNLEYWDKDAIKWKVILDNAIKTFIID